MAGGRREDPLLPPPIDCSYARLEGEVPSQNMVIATGGVLNAGAHAEDIVLEEQGNVGGLVPGDLIYLLHQRCTLGLIGLNRCLIQQRIHLGIAVMAPVAFAHAGLAVVGIEHIVEDDHALAGAVAPSPP